MCSQREVRMIISRLRESFADIFPQEQFDVILFGSYARNDADDGADIDVMLQEPSRPQDRLWPVTEVSMKNPFARFARARDKPNPQNAVSSAPSFGFGSSVSGKSVTASTAIQMSTVYACVPAPY